GLAGAETAGQPDEGHRSLHRPEPLSPRQSCCAGSEASAGSPSCAAAGSAGAASAVSAARRALSSSASPSVAAAAGASTTGAGASSVAAGSAALGRGGLDVGPRCAGLGLRCKLGGACVLDAVLLAGLGGWGRRALGLAGTRHRQDLILHALGRQRQAPALRVDLKDLDPDLIARADDLPRALHMVGRKLGDVHEALDAIEDLDEGAEGHDLGHLALELVAAVVGVPDPLPRVLLGLLETQRDALAVAVDVEHLDLDGVADREDLARVVDVRPRELGDVDQAVDAVEVDERAEVDDVGDLSLDDQAGLEAVEDLLADLLALLLEDRSTGEHHVVAGTVELDDLGLDLGAHVLVEVGHAADVHQRGRQEATHAEVDDQPALDDLDDRALDRLARLGGRFDAAPGLLEAGALLGHDQAAVLILLRHDDRVDLLAEVDLLVRVDGLADRKLVGRDDALGLVADVAEDLVLVDPDDVAGDALALLYGPEGGVVVGDDLAVYFEQKAIRP